ncbi:MAG: DEAD/DEAH box helicase [Opitutaceae bacterium]
MPPTFDHIFSAATGKPAPFDYQRRLACGPDANPDKPETLAVGTECHSQLISIPTGLGKTAAVVLAWLWNRVVRGDPSWPRRLVYCLPMRTLVEQTRDEVSKWIGNLLAKADALGLSPEARDELQWLAEHSPIILMGGEELDETRRDWDLYPERPAILIGTQDMLLSRALNRGYGMSRARWPMHFALLNNDALWVMDEVQLMDVGLATSAQLQAFRHPSEQGRKPVCPCLTWWMSATLQPDWLESADTQAMVATLRDTILGIPQDQRRGGAWEISKPCEEITAKDTKAWAERIWREHQDPLNASGEHGRITLAIANTVGTARELHRVLDQLRKKAKNSGVDLRLVHSRFRGLERKDWRKDFLDRAACNPAADRIIVATQVIEAGVDISATTLFTELAPWSSLIQRFGRAARYGGSARVFVVDRGLTEKSSLPYEFEELKTAKSALRFLRDASLSGLSQFEQEHADLIPKLFPYAPMHLLLRRELEELFDTTPDLSGADLDISRFIRSGEERDVLVFWRDVAPRTTPDDSLQASRDELCHVAIGEARDWLTSGSAKAKAWVWDYLDGLWRVCRKEDVYPGQTILVAQDAGGYDPGKGWTGDAADCEFPIPTVSGSPSDYLRADASAESEAASQCSWESIAVHGDHVARVLADISAAVSLPASSAQVLQIGARWHDVGKAHAAFQGSILANAIGRPGTHDIAKAPRGAWDKRSDLYKMASGERRPGFRHELASTLSLFAILERHAPLHEALLGKHRELLSALGHALPTSPDSPSVAPPEQDVLALNQPSFDLLAYVVCAHHGKVRGAWHAAPADQDYRDRDGRGLPIHGVREGDSIPTLSLTASDGRTYLVQGHSLRLDPAHIGLSVRTGASWAERVAGLLEAHGPFTLAFLEALLRAADSRASRSSPADSPPLANAARRPAGGTEPEKASP